MSNGAQAQQHSAFSWNPGGWWGSQIGSTLWMLLLGILLLRKDALAAGVCLAAFTATNLVGLALWLARRRVSAFAAIEGLLATLSVAIAVVVVVANQRGLSVSEPGALVSTSVPYLLVFMGPGMMLLFYLKERAYRRRGGGSDPTQSSR